jgi:hypothetical protein
VWPWTKVIFIRRLYGSYPAAEIAEELTGVNWMTYLITSSSLERGPIQLQISMLHLFCDPSALLMLLSPLFAK